MLVAGAAKRDPRGLSGFNSNVQAWVPPVDIFEEADAIRIMAEVPGCCRTR